MVAMVFLQSLPFQVLMAPCLDSLENRTHCFSVIGDTVFNPRRDFGINRATDQALVLHW